MCFGNPGNLRPVQFRAHAPNQTHFTLGNEGNVDLDDLNDDGEDGEDDDDDDHDDDMMTRMILASMMMLSMTMMMVPISSPMPPIHFKSGKSPQTGNSFVMSSFEL